MVRMDFNETTRDASYEHQLRGSLAASITFPVLQNLINDYNNEVFGLPINITKEQIKSGLLSSAEDCLLIENTDSPKKYCKMIILIESKGKIITIQTIYNGRSRTSTDDNYYIILEQIVSELFANGGKLAEQKLSSIQNNTVPIPTNTINNDISYEQPPTANVATNYTANLPQNTASSSPANNTASYTQHQPVQQPAFAKPSTNQSIQRAASSLQICPICGSNIEQGDAFCEGCGYKVVASIYTACVHCGQLSDDADAFCEFCGNKVNGSNIPQKQIGGVQQGYNTPPPISSKPVTRQPAYVPPLNVSTQPIRQPANVPPVQAMIKPRMLLVLLLDTSAASAPYIKQLIINISQFIVDVNSDNAAQNILDMALVQFNDKFSVLQDLPDITNINQSNFISQGGANYSAPIMEALHMVEDHSRSNQQIYKPWVIMISSSEPSDEIISIATELKNRQSSDKLRFMALNVDGQNSATQKKLTDVVFRQKGNDFTQFFEWVGKCIKTIARTTPNEKPLLPQLEGNVYRDK